MSYKVNISKTGTPDVMKIVEHEIPSAAGGDILVRNHATAVNFVDGSAPLKWPMPKDRALIMLLTIAMRISALK